MPSVFGISLQRVPGFLRPSRQTTRRLRDTSPRESITILRGNKLGGSFEMSIRQAFSLKIQKRKKTKEKMKYKKIKCRLLQLGLAL